MLLFVVRGVKAAVGGIRCRCIVFESYRFSVLVVVVVVAIQ